MTEEEKGKIHEVDRSLRDDFKEKPFIYKEVLRMVKTVAEDIEQQDMNPASKVGRFPFLGLETFHSSKVALVSHCDSFDCFYIDFNSRLQKISIPAAELE